MAAFIYVLKDPQTRKELYVGSTRNPGHSLFIHNKIPGGHNGLRMDVILVVEDSVAWEYRHLVIAMLRRRGCALRNKQMLPVSGFMGKGGCYDISDKLTDVVPALY